MSARAWRVVPRGVDGEGSGRLPATRAAQAVGGMCCGAAAATPPTVTTAAAETGEAVVVLSDD